MEEPQLSFLQRVYAKSCDILNNSTEYFASFSIGQSVLRQTDRLLWTIEKCAEWSVPTPPASNKQSNSNGTFGKPGPLVRPLPWLLFLPMLLFLRVIRFSLNVGAMLIGMETVKPSKMVRFIQVRRRRIRALKFLGLRRIRQKKMEKAAQLTWKETFYSIMSRAMCFRVTNSDMYEQITIKKETQEDEQGFSSKRLVLNANIAGQSCILCQGHRTNLEFRLAMQFTVQPITEQQCHCLAITSGEGHQQSSKTKSKSNGKDLKRKYIEILKNNYYDWEEVEDDEELIDRITQLAEEDDNDSDFVPAEDSATEDDSMSDAEEDTPIPTTNSSQSDLQRLASQGSLSNATIEEENENEDVEDVEESDSTTVSANSDDESSQHMSAGETPKKEETPKKPDTQQQQLQAPNAEVTSDEYYSPVNSISTSPELKTDEEMNKCNKQQNNKLNDKKETESFISSEIKQASVLTLNNNNTKSNSSKLPISGNKQPIIVHETSGGHVKPSPNSNTNTNSNSNSNSHTSSSLSSPSSSSSSPSSFGPRGHGKKHKRRLSNLLRRKRK